MRGRESRRHGGERNDRGPDQDGERDVRHHGPRLKARPHVGRADHDLSDEQDERGGRESNERGLSVSGGSRPDRRPQHEEHRDRGQGPVEEHRRGGAAERGHEPPIHQGPVREHELGVARPDVRPDQQEEPDDGGRDESEPREGPIAVTCLRVLGPDGARDIRHVGDQDQRRHEVRGHPPGVELCRHHHGAESGLRQHQREREDRRPAQGRLPAGHADRGEAGERREDDHEERHRAMGELDQRMDGPRGEEVTGLAGRPGGASEAGAGPSHQTPDREQHDRGDRGGEGEGTEAGTGDEHRDHG